MRKEVKLTKKSGSFKHLKTIQENKVVSNTKSSGGAHNKKNKKIKNINVWSEDVKLR